MNQKFSLWIAVAGMFAQIAVGQDAAKTNAAPAEPVGVPHIQFDKLVYDFGKTSMVTQLAGKFIVSNTGSATLEIKKPQPQCGCTVPALAKDKLAPGEKTELAFTVNISTSHGNIDKKITVPSNDPAQPSTTLSLKAEIVPTFDFNPASINVGDIHQGVITNIIVKIKRLDGKPLGLTKAEVTPKFIRTKLTPVAGTNDAAELRVEIEAEGAARQFGEAVKVYAGDTPQPAFVVPVAGKIVGDLTAVPEVQFWGVTDPANWPGERPEQATRKFQLTSNKADFKLEIKKATSDLEDMRVEVRPIEDGKKYEIVATLTKAPAKSVVGSIKVETNIASQPVVELGLRVNVIPHN